MIVTRNYYTYATGRKQPGGFRAVAEGGGGTVEARRWSDGSGTRLIINPYCYLEGPNRGAVRLAQRVLDLAPAEVWSSRGDWRRKGVARLFELLGELPAGWRRVR